MSCFARCCFWQPLDPTQAIVRNSADMIRLSHEGNACFVEPSARCVTGAADAVALDANLSMCFSARCSNDPKRSWSNEPILRSPRTQSSDECVLIENVDQKMRSGHRSGDGISAAARHSNFARRLKHARHQLIGRGCRCRWSPRHRNTRSARSIYPHASPRFRAPSPSCRWRVRFRSSRGGIRVG